MKRFVLTTLLLSAPAWASPVDGGATGYSPGEPFFSCSSSASSGGGDHCNGNAGPDYCDSGFYYYTPGMYVGGGAPSSVGGYQSPFNASRSSWRQRQGDIFQRARQNAMPGYVSDHYRQSFGRGNP